MNPISFLKSLFSKPETATAQQPRRTYAGAQNSRLLSDWLSTGVSENDAARMSLEQLRNRSRELCRRDDYAKRFLRLSEANVIGSQGITLKMDVTDFAKVKGKWVNTPDDYANTIIETAFWNWSKAQNYTTSKRISRAAFARVGIQTLKRDGEVLARIVRGASNDFGFSIQPLESDQLDHNHNEQLSNGNRVELGVERTQWGEPVAYTLWTRPASNTVATRDKVKLPAADVLHVYRPQYFSSARGIPETHTSLIRAHMLHGYEEAELVASRASACKMGFVTRKAEEGGKYVGDGTDDYGNTVTEAEPGTIDQLPPGWEFQSWDPTHPGTNFDSFRKAILRGMACGFNVSYNSLASDLESVNYSSLRAGALEDREAWMIDQELWIEQFELPLFAEWLRYQLILGKQLGSLPVSKFEKFNSPRFIARRWPWVDPSKDIEAARAAVDLRVKARGDIIAENGGDLEDTFRRIQTEQDLAESMGIELEPEKPEPAGAVPEDDKSEDPKE
jgi:lambda family phage portal protein